MGDWLTELIDAQADLSEAMESRGLVTGTMVAERLLELERANIELQRQGEATELERLKAEAESAALRNHLIALIPMAKGYAAHNPVGRNDEMVSNAQKAIDAAIGKQ